MMEQIPLWSLVQLYQEIEQAVAIILTIYKLKWFMEIVFQI